MNRVDGVRLQKTFVVYGIKRGKLVIKKQSDGGKCSENVI